jgi:hypothetical protein
MKSKQEKSIPESKESDIEEEDASSYFARLAEED